MALKVPKSKVSVCLSLIAVFPYKYWCFGGYNLVSTRGILACDFNSTICFNVKSTPIQESVFITLKFRIPFWPSIFRAFCGVGVCKPNTYKASRHIALGPFDSTQPTSLPRWGKINPPRNQDQRADVKPPVFKGSGDVDKVSPSEITFVAHCRKSC